MLHRRPSFARVRGFTLIEASLATIIVGVGVLAAVQLFHACTSANRAGNHLTTGMLLATHLEEAMTTLPLRDPQSGAVGSTDGDAVGAFDDIDDFNNAAFSPPRDSMQQLVSSMPNYTQVVTVTAVQTDMPSSTTVGYTGVVRVLVRVLHRADVNATATSGQEVYRATWLALER